MRTRIAIIGCGYVAGMYLKTLPAWEEELEIIGAWDHDLLRLKKFTKFFDIPAFTSFDEMLADDSIEIVVNLTNPHAHFETTKAILNAGKHAYVEKPLAMNFKDAKHLTKLAAQKRLEICSAPASVLGESAQTLWKAVREEVVGRPHLIYAEIDDGQIHNAGYERWKEDWGSYWPALDEFRTGCTLEHAGYMLTWLVAMFGPVEKMVSEAKLCIPEKGAQTPPNYTTPDFATSTLTFKTGMVARLTMSVVAPHDHRLRIFCDHGILAVNEVWDFSEPVVAFPNLKGRLQQALHRRFGYNGRKVIPLARKSAFPLKKGETPMGFGIGIADMARSIKAGRRPRLNAEFGLHVTEVSLAIQHPEIFGHEYKVTTSFEEMEPMPWAA